MIFSRLRRAKILHCIREYLCDNFHFSGNYHSKPRTDTPFKLFHSPAFAPPAELKQASKMLGWEIPSPLEENPTHTYGWVLADSAASLHHARRRYKRVFDSFDL